MSSAFRRLSEIETRSPSAQKRQSAESGHWFAHPDKDTMREKAFIGIEPFDDASETTSVRIRRATSFRPSTAPVSGFPGQHTLVPPASVPPESQERPRVHSTEDARDSATDSLCPATSGTWPPTR